MRGKIQEGQGGEELRTYFPPPIDAEREGVTATEWEYIAGTQFPPYSGTGLSSAQLGSSFYILSLSECFLRPGDQVSGGAGG